MGYNNTSGKIKSGNPIYLIVFSAHEHNSAVGKTPFKVQYGKQAFKAMLDGSLAANGCAAT